MQGMNDFQEQDINEIIKARRDKLDALIKEGKNPYHTVSYNKTAASAEIKENYDKFEGKTVSVAGRIISKRVMGKNCFAHILDNDGTIQLYAKIDILGDKYAEFIKYDIGDIIGAIGEIFTTKTGEISVKLTDSELLSKSLLPLPEK